MSRQSKRISGREGAAPDAKKGPGSTGLTSQLGEQTLDWDGDIGEAKRSESFVKRSLKSFGRGGGKKTPPLPKNWKLVKEKDGAFGKEKVYYLNSVTNQRSHEPPPPLPKGWKAATQGQWACLLLQQGYARNDLRVPRQRRRGRGSRRRRRRRRRGA